MTGQWQWKQFFILVILMVALTAGWVTTNLVIHDGYIHHHKNIETIACAKAAAGNATALKSCNETEFG